VEQRKMPGEVTVLGVLARINLVAGVLGTIGAWTAAGQAEVSETSHFYVFLGIGVLVESLIVSTLLYAIAEILKTLVNIENAIKERPGASVSPPAT
jgi:hypothetical protein